MRGRPFARAFARFRISTPQFILDGYYSGAYFQRNFGLLASTTTPRSSYNGILGFTCIGFGFPGSSNTNNRTIQEGYARIYSHTVGKPELREAATYHAIFLCRPHTLVSNQWKPKECACVPRIHRLSLHSSVKRGEFRGSRFQFAWN